MNCGDDPGDQDDSNEDGNHAQKIRSIFFMARDPVRCILKLLKMAQWLQRMQADNF
jgi:hypothetical protein